MKERSRSHRAVMLVCAVLGLVALQLGLTNAAQRQSSGENSAAIRAAQERFLASYAVLHTAREALPLTDEIQSELQITDPLNSGYIGLSLTGTTTTEGSLRAKRLSTDPLWVARIAAMLRAARAAHPDSGGVVWIGASGSFPALTVASILACEAKGLRAFVIPSLTASNHGANVPGFDYLTMEETLIDAGVLHSRSIAASVGGDEDRGRGLDAVEVASLRNTIAVHGIPLIDAPNAQEAVNERIARWREASNFERPLAFINVGGNQANLGPESEARFLTPGLTVSLNEMPDNPRGVAMRLLREGVPVIHLLNLERLAAQPIDQNASRSAASIQIVRRGAALLSLIATGLWVSLGLRAPALGPMDIDQQ